MREEILAGLKNAIEHGSSLESAVQSFINAGYNPSEVKETASSLSDLGVGLQNSQPAYSQTPQLAIPSNRNVGSGFQELPNKQNNNLINSQLIFNNQKPRNNKGIIIAIIISLLVFLSSIGYMIYVLLFSK